ncbi:Hypothetical protein NTJ_07440 [Nesidiocoris tenuis]|uniref:Uncharacterized protein n=1 Tax=Nesidiocoris tenuis TaxID=355587 RepID=A0ABN7AR02_9HEMI|nr:Hypothetical protein NTJ_07440 [Nesidiocoris tenuis]
MRRSFYGCQRMRETECEPILPECEELGRFRSNGVSHESRGMNMIEIQEMSDNAAGAGKRSLTPEDVH